MPGILLTGFEPFGDSRINPSAEVVTHLAAQFTPDLQLATQILPVDAVRAPVLLRDALISLQPDWCVMLGQADGRAAISIERVAVNLCDFSRPDNGGHQLIDVPIEPDGPVAYFATLPIRPLLESLQAIEIPGELSLSAGAYLCNMAFYVALHTCHVHALPTRCGFVHLPLLPSQAIGIRHAPPTMALDTQCTGILALLRTLEVEIDAMDFWFTVSEKGEFEGLPLKE